MANVLLVTGGGWLLRSVVNSGGLVPALMLGISILCGYVYQGPPFRFSYRGWGEALCFIAFGPLATAAFYLCCGATTTTAPAGAGDVVVTVPSFFATLQSIPEIVWGASVLVGVSTSIILLCSHFHQIQGDRAAGKLSPVVRLGTRRAAKVLQIALVLYYITLGMLTVEGVFPIQVLLGSLLAAPLAANLTNFVTANHDKPSVVFSSKILACKWHLAQGFVLAVGLALSAL